MTSNGLNKNIPRPRLCHLRRWHDFDGYGFNLHCERSKPGQYIGKVDHHSPAESAGLRKSDRIVEVNYVAIGDENHKQVVARIKEGVTRNGKNYPEEVILLVVDQETDEYYQSKSRKIESSDPNVEKLETEIRDGSENGNDSPRSSNRSTERSDSHSGRESSPPLPPPPSQSQPIKSNEPDQDYKNITNHTNSTVTFARKTSSPAISRTSDQDIETSEEHQTYHRYSPPVMHRDKPQATPSTHTYTNINSSPKPSIKQDSYTNNSSQSSSSANGSKGIINLDMSAAEYREKLKAQSSRKRDPRQTQKMSMKEKRDFIDRL